MVPVLITNGWDRSWSVDIFHAFNTKYTMVSQSALTNIAFLPQNLLGEQD